MDLASTKDHPNSRVSSCGSSRTSTQPAVSLSFVHSFSLDEPTVNDVTAASEVAEYFAYDMNLNQA